MTSTPFDRLRPARRSPMVFAHRGARARAPENTMRAFELALAEGADGVELDVRTTADDAVVVFHDADCARITRGEQRRTVAEMTSAELRAVDAGGGERVPTLADVLDWAESTEIIVNVELKRDVRSRRVLVERVARLLRARPRVAERVFFSSFEPRLLAYARLYARGTPRGFLVHAGQDLAWTVATRLFGHALGAFAIHPERTLCTPALVDRWKRAGFLVNVWTVNDPSEVAMFTRLGVDGIITDDPAMAIAAAAEAVQGGGPGRSQTAGHNQD